MLNQQTIEKLYAMRMRGMADAFTQQQEEPQSSQLSFEERFAMLVDRQWNWRQNRALERRLKEGRLQGAVCVEDIDFRAARGLDRQVVRALIQDSAWVQRHQHIFLVGPTGIGKTFLARAFGQKACRDGFTAYFATAAQLFREIELARADGSYTKKLRALVQVVQVDALIVDDWAMAPLADSERRAFLEICDERYQTRATLLTSQLPVAKWHAQIGDPTVADSILDRLVHAAHRIELQGESMRKKKPGQGDKTSNPKPDADGTSKSQ
jgi:DNA replication protein DnaC